MLTRFADWLLGSRCVLGCGQRVFLRDVTRHVHTDHEGDLTP